MSASRIANVTAAIRTGPAAERAAGGVERDGGARRALGALCRALFEEVIELRAAGPRGGLGGGASAQGADGDRLAGLAAVLSATDAERVLVLEAEAEGEAERAVSAEALLALVAWPERSVIQPVDADGADLPWALFQREECLARIRALEGAAGGSADRAALDRALEAALGIERVSPEALGIAEGGAGGGSRLGHRDGFQVGAGG